MTSLSVPEGSVSLPLRGSATMLRRSLRRIVRYPSMTLMLIGLPLVLLFLFVFVFGGTLGAGSATPRAAEPSTPTMSPPRSW